jgi:type IV pilus assembly protein PilZ
MVNLPVKWEGANGQPLPGLAVDLSVGGLYVEASEIPPFGAEVTIVVDLGGGEGTRLPGVVRWMKPGGFGVQFGLLGAKQTHLLAGLLHRAAT